MIINTKKYIEELLKIRTKSSDIVPFKLNTPQMKLYNAIKEQAEAGKPQRIILLKARQMGFSTLTEAIIFKKTATAHNVSSGIVTHKEDATTNLFNMSKLFYEELPEPIKPQTRASNAREIIFDNKTGTGFRSKIKCMTAGGGAIGRSDTFHNLHVSEYAFWTGDKKTTLNGLLQAVPNDPNSLVIIESTANGFDHFKELWDMAVAGENDFTPVFCAWWEMPEYRMPYNGECMSEEEFELKKLYSLDDEQIIWRRWCISNNCGGDINLFKQEYPANPFEAFISTGASVFNKEEIIAQLEKKIKPLKEGYFKYNHVINKISDTVTEEKLVDIKFIESSDNPIIRIYEDVNDGMPYVLGGDTAGEGSDSFTGQVINNTNGRQVAVLTQKTDEDLYAKQIYCLGIYYNTALIGIEVNFSTYPIMVLEKLNYPNLYVREQYDEYTKTLKKSYGFRTTSSSRPIAIAEFKESFREDPTIIVDSNTLQEMLTFIRNERGKPEAMQGKHDDHVMARAITEAIRNQQSFKAEITEVKTIRTLPKELETDDSYEKGEYMEW